MFSRLLRLFLLTHKARRSYRLFVVINKKKLMQEACYCDCDYEIYKRNIYPSVLNNNKWKESDCELMLFNNEKEYLKYTKKFMGD